MELNRLNVVKKHRKPPVKFLYKNPLIYKNFSNEPDSEDDDYVDQDIDSIDFYKIFESKKPRPTRTLKLYRSPHPLPTKHELNMVSKRLDHINYHLNKLYVPGSSDDYDRRNIRNLRDLHASKIHEKARQRKYLMERIGLIDVGTTSSTNNYSSESSSEERIPVINIPCLDDASQTTEKSIPSTSCAISTADANLNKRPASAGSPLKKKRIGDFHYMTPSVADNLKKTQMPKQDQLILCRKESSVNNFSIIASQEPRGITSTIDPKNDFILKNNRIRIMKKLAFHIDVIQHYPIAKIIKKNPQLVQHEIPKLNRLGSFHQTLPYVVDTTNFQLEFSPYPVNSLSERTTQGTFYHSTTKPLTLSKNAHLILFPDSKKLKNKINTYTAVNKESVTNLILKRTKKSPIKGKIKDSSERIASPKK